MESLFNKSEGLKKTPTQVLSCDYCENFNSIYLEERILTTVSVMLKQTLLTICPCLIHIGVDHFCLAISSLHSGCQ